MDGTGWIKKTNNSEHKRGYYKKKKTFFHVHQTFSFACGKEASHLYLKAPVRQLVKLVINRRGGGDTETHLRLDRGVYGGVGFSRDLSVRESGERDGVRSGVFGM